MGCDFFMNQPPDEYESVADRKDKKRKKEEQPVSGDFKPSGLYYDLKDQHIARMLRPYINEGYIMDAAVECITELKVPIKKEEQPVSEFQPQHPQYWIVGFLVRLLAPSLLPLAPASLIYQGLGEGQWTMKAHWTTKDQIEVTFDRRNP